MNYLRQSTITSIKMGPFISDADGSSAATGLTIPQSAVRLTKNGGDYAQKNSGTSASHDEFGWYDVPINATDTNTPGALQIAIHGTGALPVWREFTVLEENVYDAVVASSAALGTDIASILADTNELQADDTPSALTTIEGKIDTVDGNVDAILVDTAEIGAAGAGLTEAGGTGDQLTAVPWNSSWDAEVESEANDALVALKLDHLVAVADADDPVNDSIVAKLAASDGDWSGFANSTDALEALRDHVGDGTNLTEAGGTGDHLSAVPWNSAWDAEVESEALDALVSIDLDHLINAAESDTPADNSIIAKLAASDGDWSGFDNTTDSLEAIRDNQAGADASAIADAVWDEAFGDHTVGTSFGGLAAAIVADTNELQADDYPARFTTVDNYVQAILADTGTAGVVLAGTPDVNVASVDADAINNAAIADFALSADKIGTNAITADKIAADAITSSELATSAAQEIRDEILADSTPFNGADIAAILTDTGEIGAAGAGLTAVPWNASWDAEVESEANDALVALNLDHLLAAAGTGAHVTDDSLIAQMVSKSGTADWDSFDNTTDSLEAIADSEATPPTAASIADAVWEEAHGDHIVGTSFGGLVATIEGQTDDIGAAGAGLTEAGGTGDHLSAIPWNAAWDAEVQSEAADALTAYDPPTAAELTSEIDDVQSDIAGLNDPTAAAIADAVWEEPKADHTTGTSFGDLATDLDAVLTDTADMQPKLGSPAGASISADIAAIEGQTDDIGTAGAGLTAVPWNASWDTEVQSEVTDALNAYDPPTDAEMDAAFAALNDLSAAEVNAEVDTAFTTQMADAVSSDGAIATREQALYMILQFLTERAVSGTAVTVTKVDGSTSLFTLALDDGTDPTSITRDG